MISKEQKEKLIQEAKSVLQNTYARQHKSNYSAAVLTKQGNIYPAISYFSDTYTLTLHGEQAALAHAACHGEGDIVAIAITSREDKKSGEFTNPCHLCKQLLYESSRNSHIPMLVILINEHNESIEIQLNDMITYPWPA